MAKPSVLDRIKELEAEKAKLLDEAKATALAAAEQAISDLNELGFNYRLVDGSSQAPKAPRPATTGTRRTGIRETIMETVQSAGPDGITPATIRQKLGIADEDKSGSQSVANALSNLKAKNRIALNNGLYTAA